MNKSQFFAKKQSSSAMTSQEKLSRKAREQAKVFASRQEFGEAAAVLADALDQISDPQVYTGLAQCAAELLADSGQFLFRRATEQNDLVKISLEQAIRCYEVALNYYAELKSVRDVALCYMSLVEIRRELLSNTETKEEDSHRELLICEAKAALIYYHYIHDSEVAVGLESLIIAYSDDCQGEIVLDKYDNVLSEAKEIFHTYRNNPNKVAIVMLINSQIRLERVIETLSESAIEMKRRCHNALMKVHFTHAMCTKIHNSAKDHLSSALSYLSLVKLGSTLRSQDLLTAVGHHMTGIVLLRYKKNKEAALTSLQKAYAIYQKYDRQEEMEAITQIAPSISTDTEPLHVGQRGP